jgi:hypothetical protein
MFQFDRDQQHPATILSIFFFMLCVGGANSDSNDIAEEDLTQKCMMAVLSPEENGWYDKVAPVFEVQVTSACNCVTDEIGIQIQVARENNKRNLNATTMVPVWRI